MAYVHPGSCRRGHPSNARNVFVYWRKGSAYPTRQCRVCRRLYMQKKRLTKAGRAQNKAACRAYYRAHPEMWKNLRRKTRQWLTDHKATLSCSVCGEKRTPCLDLHHRDPSAKRFQIAQIVSFSCGIKRLKAELAKCDVLCANCHRWHHHLERQKRKAEQAA